MLFFTLNRAAFAGTATMALLAAVVGGVSHTAHAQSFTNVVVAGTTNLYGAGRVGAAATPAPQGLGGGTSPASTTFTLNTSSNRVLTFSSVTGTVVLSPGFSSDPDGNGNNIPFNTSGYQGISGMTSTGRVGFLTGVFITDGLPSADNTVGTPPANLVYTAAGVDTFTTSSPLLYQAFFIGNGKAELSGNAIQQFFVPTGATRFVLGFEDAPSYSGTPGAYFDNSGFFTASFTVSGAAAPEPGTVVLLLMGGVVPAAGFLHRRKFGK